MPTRQVHAAYPPSFNIRRNICNRINSLYFYEIPKRQTIHMAHPLPEHVKRYGLWRRLPTLGSLGRDGQGRGSLPQSHVPSQNLFRESTSTGRERIKSSVLDNDFMMPAQETSKSCTTWPPAGASGPFSRGRFPASVNHGTDHRFHGFKPVFQGASTSGTRAVPGWEGHSRSLSTERSRA